MEIDKVLEVLNNALREKDTTIWLREKEIENLKAELSLALKAIEEITMNKEIVKNEQSN